MGKGGGCFPSKNRPPPITAPDPPPIPPLSQRSNSFSTQSQISIATHSSSIRITNEPIHQIPNKNLRIFIVFYSMYRHVETLARRIKKGVDEVEGVEGVLYRVPETMKVEDLRQMRVPVKNDEIPVITVEALAEADGFLFGFPTRFGSMASQMKAFFDSTTGELWREQKLAGVPAGFFVSTGTQGGGQETTAWTAITQLAHHGMLFVPVGYTFGAGMFGIDSIRGGSPYGAGVFSGDGTREPNETELALAHHQGKYMANIVKRLGPRNSFAPKQTSK